MSRKLFALALLFLPFLAAQEVALGPLSELDHQVSGDVFIISERVVEIRNFSYDGGGPAVYWWIDTDSTPSRGGKALTSPDNVPSCGMRLGFFADGSKTVRVELPDGESFNDYAGGSLSVWCERFGISFGDVEIPTALAGVPPVSAVPLQCFQNPTTTTSTVTAPTSESPDTEADSPTPTPVASPTTSPITLGIAKTPEGFNCEPLSDNLQVRWRVLGDALEIDLIGMISENEYMAFGRSGSDTQTLMTGGDVVLADVKNGVLRARDIFLSNRAPCVNGQGVCPDSPFMFVDDVFNVTGTEDAGLTQVRYTRPLVPTDTAEMVNGSPVDRDVSLDDDTFVIWAIGPVNQNTDLPAIHTSFSSRDDALTINFGRAVEDNCIPLVGSDETDDLEDPFIRQPISADTTELFAHIGPSGGERGYKSISGGETAWGIAWYINGDLIPEVQMRRGTTYKIHVNGGSDPDVQAAFHPMYLTSSSRGGYEERTPLERAQETVFAGIGEPGSSGVVGRQAVEDFEPTAIGPLCRYRSTAATNDAQQTLSDYGTFISTLDTSCADDEAIISNAGIIEFTPDESTPDLIYYQCVTHENLGWKIRVLDVVNETQTSSAHSWAAGTTIAFITMFALLF